MHNQIEGTLFLVWIEQIVIHKGFYPNLPVGTFAGTWQPNRGLLCPFEDNEGQFAENKKGLQVAEILVSLWYSYGGGNQIRTGV